MSVPSNAFVVQESVHVFTIFTLKNLLQHQKIIFKRMWKKKSHNKIMVFWCGAVLIGNL